MKERFTQEDDESQPRNSNCESIERVMGLKQELYASYTENQRYKQQEKTEKDAYSDECSENDLEAGKSRNSPLLSPKLISVSK